VSIFQVCKKEEKRNEIKNRRIKNDVHRQHEICSHIIPLTIDLHIDC